MTLPQKPDNWRDEQEQVVAWVSRHAPLLTKKWKTNKGCLVRRDTGDLLFPTPEHQKYALAKIHRYKERPRSMANERFPTYNPFSLLLDTRFIQGLDIEPEDMARSPTRSPPTKRLPKRSTSKQSPSNAVVEYVENPDLTAPEWKLVNGVNENGFTCVQVATNELVVPDGSGKVQACRVIYHLTQFQVDTDTDKAHGVLGMLNGHQGIFFFVKTDCSSLAERQPRINDWNTKIFDTGKDAKGNKSASGKEHGAIESDFDCDLIKEAESNFLTKNILFLRLPPPPKGKCYCNEYFNHTFNTKTMAMDKEPENKKFLKAAHREGTVSFTVPISDTLKLMQLEEESEEEVDADAAMIAHFERISMEEESL